MFKGAGWFSPSVPCDIRRQWVHYGGKRAGVGRDNIRRRVWYCFCNGLQDPKVIEVQARGLVAYHALWIADSVKLQRVLPMEGYVLDPDHPNEALTLVLATPKRRTRLLGPDSSTTSSTTSSLRKRFSPLHIHSPNFSIDQDLELDDVFTAHDTSASTGPPGTPSRVNGVPRDLDDASFLSWDITPSLTFEFEVDEDEEQDVEDQLMVDPPAQDAEGLVGIDWSEMISNSSSTIPEENDTPCLELDANLVLEKLSEQYYHVLAGTTAFGQEHQYENKTFSAVRLGSTSKK